MGISPSFILVNLLPMFRLNFDHVVQGVFLPGDSFRVTQLDPLLHQHWFFKGSFNHSRHSKKKWLLEHCQCSLNPQLSSSIQMAVESFVCT